MSKIVLIALLLFTILSQPISAQDDFEAQKTKFEKFKKYFIANENVRKEWHHVKVAFLNEPCDSIFFQDKFRDLNGFNLSFEKFVLGNSKKDTVVLKLDYRDNFTVSKLLKSYEILAACIQNYSGHGIYYFSPYSEPELSKQIKADTLDLGLNHKLMYNGQVIMFSDLSREIQLSKPEVLIITADKAVLIQDLVDVMDVAKKLKVEIVLGK